MTPDLAFQKRIQRIGEMVEQIESSADPSARAVAKDLIGAVMELHGAALERILEITRDGGEAGGAIIENCGRDELVSSLLLLYGLHPENLQSRVTRALDKSRGYLETHAASAQLVSVSDSGAVTVRLEVKSAGCGSSVALVKSTMEALIQEAAPDASAIVIEDAGESLTRSGFVSLAQLETGTPMVSRQAERGGD